MNRGEFSGELSKLIDEAFKGSKPHEFMEISAEVNSVLAVKLARSLLSIKKNPEWVVDCFRSSLECAQDSLDIEEEIRREKEGR